jgi:HAD superfamily hydrolase (TIGR01450 family)
MTQFIPGLKALILDIDGVIWRGDQPLGDLPRIFAEFKHRGYQTVLATNNATLSDDQYLLKLSKLGVELEEWQIISSPDVAANYLRKKYPDGGPVFSVGEAGMIDTLAKFGFYQDSKDALAVVAGLDRQVTYEKLARATLLIRSGAMFVGTNADRTLPMPEGLFPGAGSILAALEVATDVQPVVVGKPEPEIYLFALERLKATPVETLIVGDRLDTDITGAQKIGCHTALLLSGVAKEVDAKSWRPAPDIIAPDLTSLLEWL